MHDPFLPPTPKPPRRTFLKQCITGLLSAIAGIVPGLAGLLVIFDPLKRKSTGAADARLVARLASLPADGVPRRFPVVADRVDAWTTYRNIPVGAVYLRRTSDNQITALNAACPHAGCSVSFLGKEHRYHCPCHDSSFALDGKIADPASPSPRAMDALEVQVRNKNEIWVQFRNFEPGQRNQLPVV